MMTWRNQIGFVAALVALTVLACSTAQSDSANRLQGKRPPKGGVWLDSLDLSAIAQGYKTPMSGRTIMGNPISMGGMEFIHGIGTHSVSEAVLELDGAAARFEAMVGVDDETRGKGSVAFEAWVDGKLAFESGLMKGGQEPKAVSVDLAGAKRLALLVSDGGDGISIDHADWGGALVVMAKGAKSTLRFARIEQTPGPAIASGDKPEPEIHGPRITGATPGRPFLFLIPATGEGPLKYSAEGLPDGLSLNGSTGIISGALSSAGEWDVKLTASGAKGAASRALKIVGGNHKLALTPPMGWNSWNVWGIMVDDEKTRAAADFMVSSGLAAHGYQYVNIDDTWQDRRDADGVVTTNKRFPDMKALCDYVHSKGLKIGIYSSPGKKTCAGYTGSYEHEAQDAKTYAEWGFDYLKHDWCSYAEIAKDTSIEELQKPYRLMRSALDDCSRDIVYSLCQYGLGDVWKWGADVGGNLWRTTGDIGDGWPSMSKIAFDQVGKEQYAGPGHWNDPDMLIVGSIGWGTNVKPTTLTPNEQVTHITMWAILASPLLIGCDLSQLDRFTLDLLTNDEVLDVNQDSLGRQASRKNCLTWTDAWAKEMSDGSLAVAFFNRSSFPMRAKATWAELGLTGPRSARDLWMKKDIGVTDGEFSIEVPGHGAALVRFSPPANAEQK